MTRKIINKTVFPGKAVMMKPGEQHDLKIGDVIIENTPEGEHRYHYAGRSVYDNDIYYRADFVTPALEEILQEKRKKQN